MILIIVVVAVTITVTQLLIPVKHNTPVNPTQSPTSLPTTQPTRSPVAPVKDGNVQFLSKNYTLNGNTFQGWDLAMSDDGTWLLSSAPADDAYNGAIYFWHKNETGSWINNTQYFGQGSEQFGTSVAMAGDASIAIVGAPALSTGQNDAGGFYTYVRSGMVWQQSGAVRQADVPLASSSFGNTVAMSHSGNLIAIQEQPNNIRSYTRVNDDWNELTLITEMSTALFGRGIALSHDETFMAVRANDFIFFYEIDGNQWNQIQNITLNTVSDIMVMDADASYLATTSNSFDEILVFTRDNPGLWTQLQSISMNNPNTLTMSHDARLMFAGAPAVLSGRGLYQTYALNDSGIYFEAESQTLNPEEDYAQFAWNLECSSDCSSLAVGSITYLDEGHYAGSNWVFYYTFT